MSATEEARDLRNRKLREIGSLEVFPAGMAVLAETEAGPTLREAVVAVTADDFVLLDADVKREPDGEFGRIRRAEVAGLRMVDEQGQPVAMLQSRDILELDEPASLRYVVSVDRRAGDGIASHAFVFRSLSVADEARRDFARNSRTSDATAPLGVEWSSLATRIPRLGDARSNARSLVSETSPTSPGFRGGGSCGQVRREGEGSGSSAAR